MFLYMENYCHSLFSAATLYFIKNIILFFKEKLLFILFSKVNMFLYFFLPKMVNLVIEDSSDFTFRDLMSLRG